jgi:hypothetical protein
MKLRRPKKSEMCEPGYHIVRTYQKTNSQGKTFLVERHLCKNPGKHGEILQIENLLYLFWHSKQNFPNLNTIKGFSPNSEVDPVIQFWMDYWRERGLKSPEADPSLIKAMIAFESGFNPLVKSKVKGSSAFGLMQVTDQARRILSGSPNKDGYIEPKPPFVRVSQNDIADPIVNIATGTRWLFQKYVMIPSKADKNLYNAIKNYHSWDKPGDDYVKKIEDLYKKSK